VDLRAAFALGAPPRPDITGVTMTIVDGAFAEIFSAYIPPEAFVDTNGRGTRYEFEREDHHELDGTGIDKLLLKFDIDKGWARLLAKASGATVDATSATTAITLELIFGPEPAGDCLLWPALPCVGRNDGDNHRDEEDSGDGDERHKQHKRDKQQHGHARNEHSALERAASSEHHGEGVGEKTVRCGTTTSR